MALLLRKKKLKSIVNEYDNKPVVVVGNTTTTEKATFKDWVNHHGVRRLTILLSVEPKIQAEYMVVEHAKTLWVNLASTFKSKLKITILENTDDLWSIKLQACGDINNYSSRIDEIVKN
jgi:hypothetical protein